MTQRVVIVGGGFGGLYCATHLRNPAIEVTLIDRRNFHLFQPLLYQVATGALSPANIAAPLRALLRRQRNARVLLGEVVDLDPERREVLLTSGERIAYDSLVIASGVTHQYFGHPEWEGDAPGLKTIEDATEIRHRILQVFEEAELAAAGGRPRQNPCFVIVGGGPTGVELAGAIAEIARYTLASNFRLINPAEARIVLVEAGPRILASYPEGLSANARAVLTRLGVEVREAARVTSVADAAVEIQAATGAERLPATSVLWAAGVRASPLGAVLARRCGAALDRLGRVLVEADQSLAGHPQLFVIGDLANTERFTGSAMPGVAQVAMQQGKFVAGLIRRRALSPDTQQTASARADMFRYRDLGNMATIGRAAAVAQIGPLRLSGLLGWLTWLFIHLLYIVQFENKVLVLTQWAWSYFTRGRSARLITGDLDGTDQAHDAHNG